MNEARVAALKAELAALVETQRADKAYKDKARRAAALAARSRKIIRPETCEHCGERARSIQFHHAFGYDEPNWLRGEWLCGRCHYKAGETDDEPTAWETHRKRIDRDLRAETKTVRLWAPTERGAVAIDVTEDGTGHRYIDPKETPDEGFSYDGNPRRANVSPGTLFDTPVAARAKAIEKLESRRARALAEAEDLARKIASMPDGSVEGPCGFEACMGTVFQWI